MGADIIHRCPYCGSEDFYDLDGNLFKCELCGGAFKEPHKEVIDYGDD